MHDWRAYVRENLPSINIGPARENEIIAELALQLEQAYNEAISGGASTEEALRRAQSQLGDWHALAHEIDSAESAVPAARSEIVSGSLADLRYATRFLSRNPVFFAIAAGTLAFGIGANTAIFTVLDALLLHSLPYREPGRIMAIDTRKANQPEVESWTSVLNFEDIRNRAGSFSEVAAISPVWNLVMTGPGQAERLEALFVSTGFFPLLGVSPVMGRRFLPEDARTQAGDVVLLSHAFWQRQFGGSLEVRGKTLTLDGAARTIVGVLPAGFRYAGEPLAGTVSDIDVWLPLSVNPLAASNRSLRFLKVIGRLKPGASVEQAREEVRRIGEGLAEQYPDTNRGFDLDAQPLHAQVTGPVRSTILLMLGAVGFVLLMACANVANLLLARAAARQRELAVRAALGASRWRILRQLLTEGIVLAAAGGVAGLLVAYGGLRLLVAVAPATMIGGRTIALDTRALSFAMAAVVVCAMLAGLPPAWRIARADIESVLREAGRGLTAGHHRLRSLLVVAQVSVALLLLVGSALLIRSFQRLLDVNPGFQAQNLITLTTQVGHSVQTPQQRAAAYERMRDRLLSVPGLRNVAAVSRLPLQGRNVTSWLSVEGRTSDGPPDEVEYRVATSSYFETMGIPLRAGRLFNDQDNPQATRIILINETAARRFWPGGDPVGRRVKLGLQSGATPWITVIGVVGDIRHAGLDIEPRAEIYRPYAVNPLGNPVLVVRTETDAGPMVNMLAAKAAAVSPDMPVYNVYRMQTLVERSAAQRRFAMWLLTAFAVSALLLAGVGVYGTVSQAVVQRTREIGLRMALGASPEAALRLVFGDGLRLAAAGIAIGTVAAAGLTRLIVGLLFEVRPLDPAAFAAGALVLAGFAVLACYLPARRATRVDPLTTLREDT